MNEQMNMVHPGLTGPRLATVFCPHPPTQTYCNPGRETQLSVKEQQVSHTVGCPRVPEKGHPPSERSVAPISRGMTSNGKTPLSPTMSEPRREQIQVSSLSPLSRAPQDSLSLLSRRQAAAAPRFRRACWEPPAPPRSSRATAMKKRSLWPAMPQPEQGHPGMPGAEKHKGHLHGLPPLAEHLLMKYGILTLLLAWPRASVDPNGGCTKQRGSAPPYPKDHTLFPSKPASDCVSACLPEAKLSLMTG